MRFSASERSLCIRFSSATSCSLATAIRREKYNKFSASKMTRYSFQRCQTGRRETMITRGKWGEGEKETLESSLGSPHVCLVLAELLNLTESQVGEGVGAGELVLVEGQIFRQVLLPRGRGGGTAGEPCQRSCLAFPLLRPAAPYSILEGPQHCQWSQPSKQFSEGNHGTSYRGIPGQQGVPPNVSAGTSSGQDTPCTPSPSTTRQRQRASVGHSTDDGFPRRCCGNSVSTGNMQMPTGLLRWGRCCIPSCRRSQHGLERTRAFPPPPQG